MLDGANFTTITIPPSYLPIDCTNYINISDWTRLAYNKCDDVLFPNTTWVRFTDASGSLLANCPVPYQHCGGTTHLDGIQVYIHHQQLRLHRVMFVRIGEQIHSCEKHQFLLRIVMDFMDFRFHHHQFVVLGFIRFKIRLFPFYFIH